MTAQVGTPVRRRSSYPAPPFDHLRRLTDIGGLYEHARGTTPRREHGYCVDDVARGLVVVCRERRVVHDDLREQYLTFVLDAQDGDGRFHNRRDADLRWTDTPSVDDFWGRALWALGTAAADPRALAAFDRGAARGSESRSPRTMAFAAFGAAAVLGTLPGHRGALELLEAAVAVIGRPATGTGWPWPEPRLAYANAALPEAMLAAGAGLGRPELVEDGTALLGWLLDVQTVDGHLSVVPVGGRGPTDDAPGFDQQPIEAAALANACARAHAITKQARWLDGIALAAGWFLGDNDTGTSMYNVDSGGGYDGLQRTGRNENQGAESTLALVSTLQQARNRPRPVPPRPVPSGPVPSGPVPSGTG